MVFKHIKYRKKESPQKYCSLITLSFRSDAFSAFSISSISASSITAIFSVTVAKWLIMSTTQIVNGFCGSSVNNSTRGPRLK